MKFRHYVYFRIAFLSILFIIINFSGTDFKTILYGLFAIECIAEIFLYLSIDNILAKRSKTK